MERVLPHMNAYGTVDISSSTNVEEALRNSGLDWNVNSNLLYDESGREIPGYRANIKSDDGSVLGVVSDKYSIIQNNEAFDFINELPKEGNFKFDSAGEFRNGRSIWVMGTLPEVNILGDNVSNNVVFVNSHDGSSGVKVMMTPIRLICHNMINLATRKAERIWSAKHTKGIFSKIDEARYTLQLANNYIDALAEEADELANISVSEDEIRAILDKMFPIDYANDTERKIKNITLFKNNFFMCYNENDIKQFKGSAWGAINAMADLIDHKTPQRVTANYYANHWNNLINGHADFDRFCREIRG